MPDRRPLVLSFNKGLKSLFCSYHMSRHLVSLDGVTVRNHNVFEPIAPASIEIILFGFPYMIAHPKVAVVFPSLYGVFWVSASHFAKAGDEYGARKFSVYMAFAISLFCNVGERGKIPVRFC